MPPRLPPLHFPRQYVEDHIRPVVRRYIPGERGQLLRARPAQVQASHDDHRCFASTAALLLHSGQLTPRPSTLVRPGLACLPPASHAGTVQKKIMNDCFDARPAEEWFQVVPLVVQALPMMGQRATCECRRRRRRRCCCRRCRCRCSCSGEWRKNGGGPTRRGVGGAKARAGMRHAGGKRHAGARQSGVRAWVPWLQVLPPCGPRTAQYCVRLPHVCPALPLQTSAASSGPCPSAASRWACGLGLRRPAPAAAACLPVAACFCAACPCLHSHILAHNTLTCSSPTFSTAALPLCREQFGIMLALGTDPVTWYRLRRLVPDIIPRGEAGWRHF